MKPLVVIGHSDPADIQIEQDILSAIDPEIVVYPAFDTPEALADLGRADALIVNLQEVRANLMAELERCRIISRLGTGYDSIDIDAATEHGIWVTYVPDYGIDEVSAHAIALLMVQARSLPSVLAASQQGIWDPKVVRPIQRLRDQTLGIIGLGRIGRETAKKGLGLGLRVIAHDPYIPAETFEAVGVEAVGWETVLGTADYISLHTPFTEATRNLIDAQALALMKPTAFLINTARGPIIDETALLAAVQAGQIAGAALDVLTVEPPPPDYPLLHEDRILITSHLAWYSEAAKRDLRVRGAEEVVRVLSGQSPRAPVNKIE